MNGSCGWQPLGNSRAELKPSYFKTVAASEMTASVGCLTDSSQSAFLMWYTFWEERSRADGFGTFGHILLSELTFPWASLKCASVP